MRQRHATLYWNILMAYFHWIHSTRVNRCSEGIGVVLHLPQGQRWRPPAAVHQHGEITNLGSPARTQACCIRSWPQGSCAASKCSVAVTGTPVPRHDAGPWGPSGWRFSRRAWRAAKGHMVRPEKLATVLIPFSLLWDLHLNITSI